MNHDPSYHLAFPMLTQCDMCMGMTFVHPKMVEDIKKQKNQTLGHLPKCMEHRGDVNDFYRVKSICTIVLIYECCSIRFSL